MKPTYAGICIERTEKATEGPWSNKDTYHKKWAVVAEEADSLGPFTICQLNSNFPDAATVNSEFIAHARQDVPELARRLKRACEVLREIDRSLGPGTLMYLDDKSLLEHADELEVMPEEK